MLSTAIEGGLFHPRCKDSTSTYYEGITTLKPVSKEEIAEMDRQENLEEQHSYYKNQAKKNRRIADNSLEKDNQRTYQHRAEENQRKADEIEEKLEGTVVKSDGSDKINKKSYAKTNDLFNSDEIPDDIQITPQALIDDLKSSDVGRDILACIENLPERPVLDYKSKPEGIRAEEASGKITIYVKNCKDVKTAVCSLIHECTHYMYGIGQSQWAECVCVAQELLHRRNRNFLTVAEKRTIIKAVKSAHPEYSWRKGGIIGGRKKSR